MNFVRNMWIVIAFHLTALSANLFSLAGMILGYLPAMPVIGTVFIVMFVQLLAMVIWAFYAGRQIKEAIHALRKQKMTSDLEQRVKIL